MFTNSVRIIGPIQYCKHSLYRPFTDYLKAICSVFRNQSLLSLTDWILPQMGNIPCEPKQKLCRFYFCNIFGFCSPILTFFLCYNQKWSANIPYRNKNIPPHLNCVAALPDKNWAVYIQHFLYINFFTKKVWSTLASQSHRTSHMVTMSEFVWCARNDCSLPNHMLDAFYTILGVYTVRSSDRPTGLSDQSEEAFTRSDRRTDWMHPTGCICANAMAGLTS